MNMTFTADIERPQRFEGDTPRSCTLECDPSTWLDALEEFFYFLKGCSYIIDEAKIRDVLAVAENDIPYEDA